mgnify:CR=1 FL=1
MYFAFASFWAISSFLSFGDNFFSDRHTTLFHFSPLNIPLEFGHYLFVSFFFKQFPASCALKNPIFHLSAQWPGNMTELNDDHGQEGKKYFRDFATHTPERQLASEHEVGG